MTLVTERVHAGDYFLYKLQSPALADQTNQVESYVKKTRRLLRKTLTHQKRELSGVQFLGQQSKAAFVEKLELASHRDN